MSSQSQRYTRKPIAVKRPIDIGAAVAKVERMKRDLDAITLDRVWLDRSSDFAVLLAVSRELSLVYGRPVETMGSRVQEARRALDNLIASLLALLDGVAPDDPAEPPLAWRHARTGRKQFDA